MTTRLSDLRKPCDCHYGKIPTKGEHPFMPKWMTHKRCGGSGTLPAEVSDLVKALQAEGAGEVVETRPFGGKGLIEVEARGRYLLVALDTLGEDA